MRKKITHDEIYHCYKIQQRPEGVITQILDGFEYRLDYLASQARQVSVAHLDVTLPENMDCKNNLGSLVGESILEVRQELERHGIVSQAGWVREVSANRNSDGKPHAHIAFMWDSEKIQDGWTIGRKINDKLTHKAGVPESVSMVHVNPPRLPDQQSNSQQYNAIKLRVNAPGAAEQRANILNRCSYLAKATGKGNTPKGIRDYGFSQCHSEVQNEA